MRISRDTETFGDVQKIVAEYFGLPPNIMFFSDSEGIIYMKDMKVRQTLFPMYSAFRSGTIPEIYVRLQRNMSTLDFLDGGRQLKQQAAAIEEDYEKVQSAKLKKANIVEAERKRELEFKELKNQRLLQKKSWQFLRGLISMIIFSIFCSALIYSAA